MKARPAFFVLALSLALPAAAGEHPEHPSKPRGRAEHPERPMKAPAKAPAAKPSRSGDPRRIGAVRLADVAKAIEEHVALEAEEQGAFTVIDEDTGEEIELKLARVHRDRLSKVGPDRFFVCADFKTPRGTLYDLDFFMEGETPDELEVVETRIHKEAGKARYRWKEEKGVWRTVPVERRAVPREEELGDEEDAEDDEL